MSLCTWRISIKAASDQLSMLTCMSTASHDVDSLLSKGAESQLPACILASRYIATSLFRYVSDRSATAKLNLFKVLT